MDRLDNLMISFLFLLIMDIHFQIILKYVEMKLYGIIGVKWLNLSQIKKKNLLKKLILLKT